MQTLITNVFSYQGDRLHAEKLPLADIAETFGTPCYVYSKQALSEAFLAFANGFKEANVMICYAVKANPSLAILHLFAQMGAGFDIVSGGELARVIAAGGDPRKVVFSGVGKSVEEMRYALKEDIYCFNVESIPELDRLNEVAGQLGLRARVSLRINPNIDAKTHPYISTGLQNNKFGIAYDMAIETYQRAQAMPNIEIHGIDCHIGSQLTELSPLLEALDRVLYLLDALDKLGIAISHIDMGGGIGIRYQDEIPPDFASYAAAMRSKLAGRPLKLLLEPGRALVGNAGILLTRVEYLKPSEVKNFAIVDAAMNDLMRPALYDAYHQIQAVQKRPEAPVNYEVVGPVCESGDFLGHNRSLSIQPGDLLAIMSAGAYGMSMSSNYNSRPKACEVLVDGGQCHLIRRRESVPELFALESLAGC